MTVCDGPCSSVASMQRPPKGCGGMGVGACGRSRGEGAPDAFGELVGLWRRGEAIEAELREVRRRLDEAVAYLARPGSNLALAAAYLDRLRRRQRDLRARLRSQRAEAWRPGGPSGR